MGDKLLFLSHAGVDSAAALALAERIERSGLKVWIDKRDLAAGRGWQQQLEEVIDKQSTAFAVYVGGRGVVNWVDSEVRVALARATGNAGYPFIPVLAKGVEPAALPAFARQFQGVQDVEGDPDALQKLVRAAQGEGGRAPLALETQPFLGLSAFDEAHTHLFFGRESETEELVGLLRKTTLLMVVGDSGSGKSSLVKAGLIPRFRGGAFAPAGGERPDETPWHVVQMRPLGAPFERLTDAVSEAARAVGIDVETRLALGKAIRTREADTIRDALREGAPPKAQTLLVVDQFEELWTLTDEPTRAAFLDALMALARPGGGTHRVVLTMRRDYYNLCSQHPELFARLEDSQVPAKYSVRRMTDEAFRRCIAQPLLLAGVADAATYADAVLKDVGDQPGELALLEMALTEAWRRRAEFGGDLLKAYVNIGRVSGALANAAEDVFRDQLNDDERRRAEAIFMRLVRLGDTGGTTRRIAAKSEFRDEGWTLAQRLAQEDHKRLLFVGADTAEIAHEALVTQWPRYQSWLQQAAADKRKLDALMDDAKRWTVAEAEKTEFLARGYDLENGLSLLNDATRNAWLSDAEIAFIAASESERMREDAERKEARKERERQLRELAETSKQLADEQSAKAELAETSRRKTRRWLAAAMVAAVAAFIGFGGAVWFSVEAQQRERQANEARQIALARQLAAQAQELVSHSSGPNAIERAAAIAIESWRRFPNSDANNAASLLFRLLPIARIKHDGNILSYAFVADGKAIFTRDEFRNVRLIAADGRVLAATKFDAPIRSIVFDPNGKRVAAIVDDDDLRVVAIDSSAKQPNIAQKVGITAIGWSPDSSLIATGGKDKMVRLLEAETGTQLAQIEHQEQVWQLLFSSDGRLLAAAGESGKVWIIEVATRHVVARLSDAEMTVDAVKFSPDNRFFITQTYTALRLYDARTWGKPLDVLHDGRVLAVAFSPDSRLVASADYDRGLVHVVDTEEHQERFIVNIENPLAVAFSRDGRRLAIGSGDNGVRLVDTKRGKELLRIHQDAPARDVIFSADGRYLVAVSGQSVRMFAAGGQRELSSIKYDGPVSFAGFGPDSQLLAIATGSVLQLAGTTDYYELAAVKSGHPFARFAFDLEGRKIAMDKIGSNELDVIVTEDGRTDGDIDYTGLIQDLVWGVDRKLVAIVTSKDGAELTTTVNGEETVRLRKNIFALSRDGRQLASLNVDHGGISITDIASGKQSLLIENQPDTERMVFSPDGQILASVGSGNSVWLFAATDGKTLARMTSDGVVSDVAISPDGRLVAVGSDGVIQIYPRGEDKELFRILCGNGDPWSLKFSPDSRSLAAAVSENFENTFWIISNEKRSVVTTVKSHTERIEHSFTSDGRFFATLGSDRSAIVVRVADGSDVTRFETGGTIQALAFSPDGRLLAVAGTDGMTRLISTQDWREIARIEDEAAVERLGFSPDSKRLAVVVANGTSKLLRSTPYDLTGALCSRAGRDLSKQEWDTYIGPDEPWHPTCEHWEVPQDVIDAGLWLRPGAGAPAEP